jgi:hypothetical protein
MSGQLLLGMQRAKSPVCLPGNRIGKYLVGERELKLWIPPRNVLALRPAGLCESVIHEDTVTAADPVENSIYDPAAAYVLAEPELNEFVQHAAGL